MHISHPAIRLVGFGVLAAAGLAAIGRRAPSPIEAVGPRVGGGWLVPSNQIVTPAGRVTTIPARPKDLALSSDGKWLAAPIVGQRAGVLIFGTEKFESTQVSLSPSALGIAWAPDGATLYVSCGRGKVARVVRDGAGWKIADQITAAVGKGDPQCTGIAVAPDGRRLYVGLGVRNAVSVVSLPNGDITATIPVGVCPYRVALSQDGSTLVVANRGGRRVDRGESTEPSAGTPVRVDSHTDAALRGSVTLIDTSTLKTSEVDVGRQPSGFAFIKSGSTLYVSNADDDSVSVVDVASRRVRSVIAIRPAGDAGFGQMPTDLALSPDEHRLYVTCGGANAVAIVALGDKSGVLGYVPTGWFPIAIKSSAGKIMVASSKGLGDRPPGKTSRWYVHDSAGTIQSMLEPTPTQITSLTKMVALNNRWSRELPARPGRKPLPVPERVGEPSVFKHVVYIIKENETYDALLGDLTEGNSDKSLNLYPESVTPNHHALARQFVLLDNTYTSGTNSADGHQWCDEAMCNAYQEQNYRADTRSYPYDGGDPLAYASSGFVWNAAAKRGLTVKVFGEFVNHPKFSSWPHTWKQMWEDYKSGADRYNIRAETDSIALRPFLHSKYIGWPIQVSDQWRASTFLTDLADWEQQERMPSLSILILPCDHTSGLKPGMPTPRASVADNDLALGRIVDGISHSRFWKDTLILVIEDDSQAAVDHVDGHRTAAFCVSAYTRRGVVDSDNFNHTSILRTIERVLGIPAMNRFDRSATPLTSCFNPTPDLTPYQTVQNQVALDEMNGSLGSLHGTAKRLALACSKLDWSGLDRADPRVVARANWFSRKPNVPFPARLLDDGDDNDASARRVARNGARESRE